MVEQRVGPIPQAVGQQWNGIAVSCHFATVFYLFWAEFGHEPDVNDMATIGNITGAIQQCCQFGTSIQNPGGHLLTLLPGTVVVFRHNGTPVHSCIAKTATSLGGCNQVNWFASPGAMHGYSVHPTGDLRWRGGLLNKHDVQGNVGQWCQLTAVQEGPARAVIRQHIQG